eukprot:gene2743-4151_t
MTLKKVIKSVNDIVCPLYKMDYEKQLELKQNKTKDCLRRIKNDLVLFSRFNNSPLTLNSTPEDPDLACGLQPIIPSPEIYSYRNVVEFTCGYDLEGNIQVGYITRNPYFHILSPQDALNSSDESKLISKLTVEFLENESFSKPYTKTDGLWREIRIRQNLEKEIMIKLILNTDGLNDQIKEEIQKYIEKLMNNGLNIKSAFMQLYTGNSVPKDCEYIHICGDKLIFEKLNNITLQTSPGSFFQVNTKAAELLYSNIKNWLKLHVTEKTVLYDIYCGIGSLGINVTSGNPILGIECITDAVYDAIHNAKLNNLHASYYCAFAEDIIPKILSKGDERVVALVNPPRVGIQKSLRTFLRECKNIVSIVYVSCNPEAFVTDVEALCMPDENLGGLPFVPVQCFTVDMFPHTNHQEIAVLLTRVQN